MIKTDKLTKRYGDLTAVDNLSFSVAPGEVLGFLGPNGAGKSTTMKMIAGFLTPSSGSVSVSGFDVESHPLEAKQRLGYLPEGAPNYGEMTPLRFLNFIADIRGLTGTHRKTRMEAVIEQLHIDGVLQQSIETLSKGFKRRVGLAQAIIHDPRVLILDEPTDGLDPNQKYEVRSLINGMAKDKIIVISTHILEEVHAVCNRIVIIADGRILVDDTPHNLESRSRHHNAVSLRLENWGEAREAIAMLPAVATVEADEENNQLTAYPRKGELAFPAISRLLQEKRWRIQEIRIETGRLDEVFREITTGVRS